MADERLYSGAGSSLSVDTKVKWMIKAVLALIGLLFLFIVGVLVRNYALMPLCSIKSFRVYSASGEMDAAGIERLKAITGINERTLYSQVNPKRMEEKIAAALPVKSVVVEKHFPASVDIYVVEREPLLLALYRGQQGDDWLFSLDSEGVVVEVGEGIADYDLPLVSGAIAFPAPNIGSRVLFDNNHLFKKLQTLKSEQLQLYNSISEIQIRDRIGSQYDVCVFFRGREYPCLFSADFKEANLINGLIIEESISKMISGKRGYVIDCRTDAPAFCRLADKESK